MREREEVKFVVSLLAKSAPDLLCFSVKQPGHVIQL